MESLRNFQVQVKHGHVPHLDGNTRKQLCETHYPGGHLVAPNRAVELLKETSAIELGSPMNLSAVLVPIYVRGEAYLALGHGDRSLEEFQNFIDQRGAVTNFLWGALARLGLARAYAMQGDTVKTKAAYQDFIALWKTPTPTLPS